MACIYLYYGDSLKPFSCVPIIFDTDYSGNSFVYLCPSITICFLYSGCVEGFVVHILDMVRACLPITTFGEGLTGRKLEVAPMATMAIPPDHNN